MTRQRRLLAFYFAAFHLPFYLFLAARLILRRSRKLIANWLERASESQTDAISAIRALQLWFIRVTMNHVCGAIPAHDISLR